MVETFEEYIEEKLEDEAYRGLREIKEAKQLPISDFLLGTAYKHFDESIKRERGARQALSLHRKGLAAKFQEWEGEWKGKKFVGEFTIEIGKTEKIPILEEMKIKVEREAKEKEIPEEYKSEVLSQIEERIKELKPPPVEIIVPRKIVRVGRPSKEVLEEERRRLWKESAKIIEKYGGRYWTVV